MAHTKIRLLLLVALTAAGQFTSAQNIYTVAGTGTTGGYTGDGGPATAALVTGNFLAFDPAGNLFISTTQTVRRVDAHTGIITTFAGDKTLPAGFSGDGGPATAAQFNAVEGVASDAAGNIYIVDRLNGRVRMVNTSGIISTFAGNGSFTYSGDGLAATSAGFRDYAFGVSVDASGNVYISTTGDARVRKVEAGIINTFAGNGTWGPTGNGGPAVNAELNFPDGLCFDPSGNCYIADGDNFEVRSVNTGGTIHTYCGIAGAIGWTGDGGPATNAEMGTPTDVKVDYSGNVYVADYTNIRAVNSSGIISTVTTSGGSTAASDGVPATSADVAAFGLAVDACGNLYTTDGNTQRVRIICNSSISSVSISASATSVCFGTPVTFTATSTHAGSSTVYTWYKSGSTTPLGTGTTFVDNTPSNGDAIYCVTTCSGVNAINSVCGVPTATSNIITLSVSTPQITDVDITTHCLPGHTDNGAVPTFTVTATGGSGSYGYSWYPTTSTTSLGIGLSNYTIANPEVTYTPGGIIGMGGLPTLWYINVTDADGCSAGLWVPVTFTTEAAFDLATRDSHFDMYDEPNSQQSYNGGVNWNTQAGPDIWNRYLPYPGGYAPGDDITNQPPQYDVVSGAQVPNYFYVTVRNVGCSLAPTDIFNLYAYWTMGGPGGTEAWPAFWNGSTPYGTCTGPASLAGNQLPAIPVLPAIAAGSSQVFEFPWYPPNPHCYTSASTMELCFFSYIEDYHNPTNSLGSFYEGCTLDFPGTNPGGWCIYNNNMANRNSSDIWISGTGTGGYRLSGGLSHTLTTGNVDGTVRVASLQVANGFTLSPGTGVSTLANYANFEVYLGPLYDIWQAAGGYGHYAGLDPDNKGVIFDGTNTMQIDSIPIDSGALYQINIAGYAVPGANLNQMQPEQIVLRLLDDSTGNPQGAYTFHVHAPSENLQGALAVTELSQGPSSAPGCEYAEMVVSNCGADWSPFVNVSGWIIDDNDGNFDTAGCGATGITRGHYRLAYNSVWENMPVGSVIVVYNADNNCYNLPDTFTIDTVHNIYWVPVNSATGADSAYVLQRYTGAENGMDSTGYCSDTGATIYYSANGWEQTIALAAEDAIQVRCPGCTSAHPGTPPFYHGLGYAPDTTYCFESIPAGTGNLGGPVEYNPTPYQKYVFMGATALDLGNPAMWTAYSADAAGTPPATLGNVDTSLYNNIVNHSLELPCCNYGGGGGRMSGNTHSIPPVQAAQGIKVYPNPATQTLNFEYPASAGSITIKLMDVTGRLMDEQVLNNTTATSFNVSGYTPGMYMYQVITNGKVQSGKVVIVK